MSTHQMYQCAKSPKLVAAINSSFKVYTRGFSENLGIESWVKNCTGADCKLIFQDTRTLSLVSVVSPLERPMQWVLPNVLYRLVCHFLLSLLHLQKKVLQKESDPDSSAKAQPSVGEKEYEIITSLYNVFEYASVSDCLLFT